MDVDWQFAEGHLRDIENRYFELLGTPGVNTSLALTFTIEPLIRRFRLGERTDELFQAIMALE
jgi:hypothetical protein